MLLLLTVLALTSATLGLCASNPCTEFKETCLYYVRGDEHLLVSHHETCQIKPLDTEPNTGVPCYFLNTTEYSGTSLADGCNLYLDCHPEFKPDLTNYIVFVCVLGVAAVLFL